MAETKQNPEYILHVYFTRYSSWGVRVALILDYFQIPHTKNSYGFDPTVAPPAHLSGGLLPVLQPDPADAGFLIGDSLAISEFLAEQNPQLHLWPKDVKLRALARTAAAQMHSGFNTMRNTYHTNFLGRYTGKIPIGEAAAKEIRQMVQLWSKARAETKKRLEELSEKDDGFLFGAFSIADSFFWPVLWRFRSYQLPMSGISEDGLKWVAKMWNDPVIKKHSRELFKQAQNPLTVVEKYENIFRESPEIEYTQFSEDWTFNPAEA